MTNELELQINEKVQEVVDVLNKINAEGIDSAKYTKAIEEYANAKKQEIYEKIDPVIGELGYKTITFETIPYQSLIGSAVLIQEVWKKDNKITKYGEVYIIGYVSSRLINSSPNEGNIQKLPLPNDVEFDMLVAYGETIYARPKAGQSNKDGIIDSLDNYLYCLGDNRNGQLGRGNIIDSKLPYKHKFNSRVNKIKISYSTHYANMSSFVILENKELYACGHNNGQLGIGNNTQVNIWTKINDNVDDIFLGGYVHFLHKNRSLYGWGAAGYVGDGSNIVQTIPVQIKSNVSKCEISIKSFFGHNPNYPNEGRPKTSTIFLLDDTLYVAGYNAFHQLISNNTNNVTKITRMTDSNNQELPNIYGMKFDNSIFSTYVLIPNLTNMDLYACGAGYSGFGDGTSSVATKFKKITTLEGLGWEVIVIDDRYSPHNEVGGEMIFLINKSNKQIKCFGAVSNQGTGLSTDSTKIVDVVLPKINNQFEAFPIFYQGEADPWTGSLAVIVDGTLYLCGNNSYKRLDRTSSLLTPVYSVN